MIFSLFYVLLSLNRPIYELSFMKLSSAIFAIITFCMMACQSDIHIDKDKVREVLTQFGKENPAKRILIETKIGNIEVSLYDETPLHRANFVRNIQKGYYTDRGFYRIVKGVCIQGGSQRDPQDFTIPAEFNPKLINKRGALAMARYTENNPGKESSATEFFIISKGRYYNEEELAKYPADLKKIYLEQGGEMLFDQEYTVFGEVTKGMDIVDKIAKDQVIDKESPVHLIKFSIKVLD